MGNDGGIIMAYEVHSNDKCALFSSERDAINALWLLAGYHDIKIDENAVKKVLDKEAYYEAWPLSIIKSDYV